MKLLYHNHAQMGMVGSAVGLLITLIIVVLIFYNISASTQNMVPADHTNKTKYGERSAIFNATINASTSVNNQAATFFTIAPIIAIVIVAVVVIGYVQRIGG